MSCIYPIFFLIGNQYIKYMVTGCFSYHFTFFSYCNCFFQTTRGSESIPFFALSLFVIINISSSTGAISSYFFSIHPFKSSSKHYTECKIWIAGRVRGPVFYTGCLFFDRFILWNPYKHKPVSSCPRLYILRRGLISRNKSLI